MLIGNLYASFQKNILKKVHYIGAGDTTGSILILFGLLIEGFEFSKVLIALIIIIIGLPAGSYFISISIIRKGK